MCFTNCGKVRLENEDSYFLDQKMTPVGSVLFAVVADGMGGLNDGKQASKMLVTALENWWQYELYSLLLSSINGVVPIDLIEHSLDNCISFANRQILMQRKKMGTTLSLLLILGKQYLIKHVGDSRIYFFRTIGLEQITNDHTWYEQERQRGTLEQCKQSVDKMKNVLVNAVGVNESCVLEMAMGELHNVETIFLCSDGVYRYLSDTVLRKILRNRKSVQRKGRTIEKLLNQSEARDNYTAILIQVKKSRCRFIGK